MKKAVLAALFLLLATVLPAAAQGPYLGIAGGLNIVHDADVDGLPGVDEVEFDYGYGFNVNGGMHFNPVRLELEFGFNQADVDDFDGDLTIMSYMVNAYYDMAMGAAPVSPFFGVGLGFIYGEVEADDVLGPGFVGDDIDDDDTVFGYQLTAGISSHLNQYLDLDVYYRFQSGFDDFEFEGIDAEYNASLIFAGLRYHF